ncbi:hypothetical protein M758_9G070500 [Ceratodon purpureus]|nr:hypothetical protein M758_9G070500 [Ceratodon purpureus]
MDEHQPTGETPNPLKNHPNTSTKDFDSEPNLPPPATYNPHRQRPHRLRRAFFACCCLNFFIFLLTLGFTVFIHWLILQPQPGNFTLTDANLNLFDLTHNTNSSTPQYSLDADIDLKITFNNPNKNMGFNIKEIDLRTFYNDEEIGEVALQPFHQPCRNATTVWGRVRITNHALLGTVGGGLQGEIERSDITLHVVINAKVRGDEGWYASLHRYRGVHLTCSVNFMAAAWNNGTVLPGAMISKSCYVNRD